ncbi:MAG: hypothetical protein WA885_04215 [Phormidesmis sp.]
MIQKIRIELLNNRRPKLKVYSHEQSLLLGKLKVYSHELKDCAHELKDCADKLKDWGRDRIEHGNKLKVR